MLQEGEMALNPGLPGFRDLGSLRTQCYSIRAGWAVGLHSLVLSVF